LQENKHQLPAIDRKRLHEAPDYAFIAQKTSMDTIKKELESLMELGSCYYEIFDRFKDDGTQISPCNDT